MILNNCVISFLFILPIILDHSLSLEISNICVICVLKMFFPASEEFESVSLLIGQMYRKTSVGRTVLQIQGPMNYWNE